MNRPFIEKMFQEQDIRDAWERYIRLPQSTRQAYRDYVFNQYAFERDCYLQKIGVIKDSDFFKTIHRCDLHLIENQDIVP